MQRVELKLVTVVVFSGESSVEVSMIDSLGSVSNPNVVPKKKCEEKKWDPLVPNNHPILKVIIIIV